MQKAKLSDKLLFTKESFEVFPDLLMSDMSFKKTTVLSNANPQQKDYKWGTIELVDFTSLDGKALKGLLVKPENFDPKKKYPLLVRIHGGPQQMFGYAYRTEYAIFSGADYAVFFCNPRGSTGYGQEFCDGINGDWGGKVIEDLRSYE